jgi:hypothetical protein
LVSGPGRTFRSTSVYVWRISFVAVGVVALVLGFIGLAQWVHRIDGYSGRPLDLIYYDLQLFVLGSPPLDNGGRLPALLEVARFAAPAVTVYALVEAARALFASELMRLRTRYSRGHDVVCGHTAIADALAARLVERGRRVVRIPVDGTVTPLRRALVVAGRPTSPEVLRNAGLARARTLYLCTDDSAQNLAIADLAAQTRPPRPPHLDVHVHVEDPEFCLALQARRLGLPPPARTAVNFFSSHELAARTLVESQPVPAVEERNTRVMVVGASRFGMALIVELARQWRLVGTRTPGPLDIVVVHDHARAATDRIRRLYPMLDQTCRFTWYDRDVATLLDGDLPEPPPDRVYLCCEDDAVSLKLALTMDHFWRRGPRSVVVRLGRLGALGTVFEPGATGPLLDSVARRVCLFDAVHAGSDPRLVEDSLVERLARAIHEHYLAVALRAGTAWGATRAMYRWHELADDLKEANRAQAVHIGTKLRAVGCVLAPNPIWGEPARFDAATTDFLAELEHERWCAYMRAAGWQHGSARDDTGRRHPDLVDWTELGEPARRKDREAVSALTEILGDAGFQIVRITGDGPLPGLPHQRVPDHLALK